MIVIKTEFLQPITAIFSTLDVVRTVGHSLTTASMSLQIAPRYTGSNPGAAGNSPRNTHTRAQIVLGDVALSTAK